MMNRRNFLRNAVLLAAGACVAPQLLAPEEAKAAVLGNVHVIETNLQFSSLDKRSFTDSIILHHVGGTDREVSAATIHAWHLKNGWSGIGYHFVVHKNGKIERGRPLDAVGAHCWHHNATSIGINLVGNFEQAETTTRQLDAAMRLIAELSYRYKLKPGAGTVFGHRDFNSTLCPGKHLYGKLPGLCTSAAKLF